MSDYPSPFGPEMVNQNQDPEAQDTVKMAMKLFQKAKQHKDKYSRNWLHYYKMYRGDQWDGIRMPRFRQKEIVNMVFGAVNSGVALQTDARPKIAFIPTEPSDTEFAKVLNQLAEFDWESNNWLDTLTEVIIDAYLYGIGFSKQDYDPSAKHNQGSATYESEDPFYCFPDPEATKINSKDSEYFIVAKPVDTKRLKRQYPEFADEIKSDVNDFVHSSKTALNDFKLRVQATDRDMPDLSQVDSYQSEGDMTLCIEMWQKPHDTKEVEVETGEVDQDGNPILTMELHKVYPQGRKIKIASGLLLEDGPLEFDSQSFPFAKYVNRILPREFYGISEVEQLESPQRVFNKLVNAALEVMNYMGNPIWVVSTDSGINPHKLVNRTGLVVEKSPGSEARREPGVQLSPSALALIDRFEQYFNNVSGRTDVSQGQTPGSVTAASAIEQLQNASQTEIRQKQRNMDMYLRDVGRQYADIVLERYSAPRVIRVTGEDESVQYLKMHIATAPDGQKKAVVHDMQTNTMKAYLINGQFDVRVNTGSSLPFTVAERESKVFALFDRGIIDASEVLDALEYPNREEILQRIQQQQEALAMQEQGVTQ